MSSEPVDTSRECPPQDEPRHIRQIVVATDDPAIVEAIQLCLYDNEIQAHVLPWRDSPPREPDSTMQAVVNLGAQEGRLLAVVAQYVRLARDTYVTGGDPCRALDWAEEGIQRAVELNAGWQKLA
jgi:hypothetical protein